MAFRTKVHRNKNFVPIINPNKYRLIHPKTGKIIYFTDYNLNDIWVSTTGKKQKPIRRDKAYELWIDFIKDGYVPDDKNSEG